MPDAISGTLTRNWLRFGLILRGLGFDAGPARMLPYLQALTLLDQRRREDCERRTSPFPRTRVVELSAGGCMERDRGEIARRDRAPVELDE